MEHDTSLNLFSTTFNVAIAEHNFIVTLAEYAYNIHIISDDICI